MKKFRVWDAEDKVMYKPLSLEELIEGRWELQSVNGEFSLPQSDYFLGGNYMWEESIGLEDEDGVDIFCGDIVKLQLPLGGFWQGVEIEQIAKVRYEAEKCAFIAEWKYSKNQNYITINCDLAMKVIGNIYENPELLK